MSRSFAPTLLYGGALLILIVVGVSVFDVLDPETPALQGGAALLLLLLAGYLALRDRGEPAAGDHTARVIPDSSMATAWVAISLATMALGAELGPWLVLIAGGMLLIGIGGLVRESRASRGLAERALAPELRGGERTLAGEGRGRRFEAPGED